MEFRNESDMIFIFTNWTMSYLNGFKTGWIRYCYHKFILDISNSVFKSYFPIHHQKQRE